MAGSAKDPRLVRPLGHQGSTKLVRDIMLAQNAKGEWGKVGITLAGLVNPTQSIPPYQEWRCNSERSGLRRKSRSRLRSWKGRYLSEKSLTSSVPSSVASEKEGGTRGI